MAEEPDNLILRQLRDLRELVERVLRKQDVHDQNFELLNRKIEDWQETTATATGLAVHANLRGQNLEQRLDKLTSRVEALESGR